MKLKFKKIFLTLAATASLIIPVSLTSCSDKNQISNAITGQDNSPNQPTGGNSSSSPSNPSNTPSQSMQSNDALPKLDTPLSNSLGLPITPEDDPNGYTNINLMLDSGWYKSIYDPIVLKVINKYCKSNFTSKNIVKMFAGYNNYCNPHYIDSSYLSFFNELDATQQNQLTAIKNTTWHKFSSTFYVVINSSTPIFNNIVDVDDNNAVVKDCIWLIKNTTYQYLIKLNVASKTLNYTDLYFNLNKNNQKQIDVLIDQNAKDDYYYQPTLVPQNLEFYDNNSLKRVQKIQISPMVNYENIKEELQKSGDHLPYKYDENGNWKGDTLGPIDESYVVDWNYFATIIKNTENPFQGWYQDSYLPDDVNNYYYYQVDCFINSTTKTSLLNLFKKIDSRVYDIIISLDYNWIMPEDCFTWPYTYSYSYYLYITVLANNPLYNYD